MGVKRKRGKDAVMQNSRRLGRPSYVWSRIPKDVDVDRSKVGRLVFHMVADSTKLGINDVILLVLEYSAKSDHLNLFLSSNALVYGPSFYVDRDLVQQQFRQFCNRFDLRGEFGIGKPSVSLSLTKSNVRKAFRERNLTLAHDRRPHPNIPGAPLFATWILGAKLSPP